MNSVRILFDLRSGIGIGDACQMSILWRHLRKYRPNWIIDVRAPEPFRGATEPFVWRFWPSEGPDPDGEYESVQALSWTDCFHTFGDRPSTKVTYALKFMFGISEYDPSLGRYVVEPEALTEKDRTLVPLVGVHFKGASHPERKNLPLEDRDAIRRCVSDLGAIPCGLEHFRGVGQLAWAINGCKAFVGIDSGPGKVASATETPALICWTGHHPLRYHDPAPNTTHLIPKAWIALPPFDEPKESWAVLDHDCVWRRAYDYFLTNYNFRTYAPGELGKEACQWLREVL